MKKEGKCGKFSYCFPREPSPPWPHRIKVFHLVSLSALCSSALSARILREMSSQNPENTAGTDLCGPRQQYGRTRDPCKSRRKFSLFWCKFCVVLEIWDYVLEHESPLTPLIWLGVMQTLSNFANWQDCRFLRKWESDHHHNYYHHHLPPSPQHHPSFIFFVHPFLWLKTELS